MAAIGLPILPVKGLLPGEPNKEPPLRLCVVPNCLEATRGSCRDTALVDAELCSPWNDELEPNYDVAMCG